MAKKNHWDIFDVAPSAREAGRAPSAHDGLADVAELVAEESVTDARSRALLHHLGVQRMARPLGASVAAVLFGIGAIGAVAVLALLILPALLGVAPIPVGGLVLLGMLLLIIARFNWRAMRGMWRGTPEGWVIGVAILFTTLIGALFSLVKVQMGMLPATSGSSVSPAWKYTIRALLAGSLLLSLATPSVRGYCGLFMQGSTRAIMRRLAPYLALGVIVQVLLLFA